jgi:RNase H-fold protein (predicted Holliday junction resolvase)
LSPSLGRAGRPLRIVSIDPGRDKCGVAVVDARDGVLARGVVPTETVAMLARDWARAYRAVHVVLGNGTGCRRVRKFLADFLDLPIELVPEANTTRRARNRYFQDNPPRSWWRRLLLPLQSPPVPVDDYAAILIAEDYLSGKEGVRPPAGG